MISDFFEACDNLHNQDSSKGLVNLIRSYIKSKLENEQKTPGFITELRHRLYLLHEYNCNVAKLTTNYPRTREFDLLLIKYIELEYDVLYSRPNVSRRLEVLTESRVLRLLQLIVYSAVHHGQSLISVNTDKLVKRTILQLLEQVQTKYLIENKLVYNIAHKILKKINENSSIFKFLKPSDSSRTATSDYGTDDSDTDFDKHTDCVEVPLTTDGVASVPTVEFVDDDDNYFVYLQREGPKKRKIKRNDRNVKKRSPDSSIVICSDSEEEETTQKKSNKGVVTFEILDDEDDDDKPNYMVYLQKEVKSKKKDKKIVIDADVIVCSDSEGEIESEIKVEESVICKSSENLESDLALENILNLNIDQNVDENFLIDPSIIIEPTIVPSNVPTGEKFTPPTGDPVITGNNADVPPLDNSLNESFLEEILSNDDYLLGNRKDFEYFQSYIFTESGEKSLYYLSNFSGDETVTHPDTFDVDMESLNLLLDDSQLFNDGSRNKMDANVEVCSR